MRIHAKPIALVLSDENTKAEVISPYKISTGERVFTKI
jgi:hypothetical protein